MNSCGLEVDGRLAGNQPPGFIRPFGMISYEKHRSHPSCTQVGVDTSGVDQQGNADAGCEAAPEMASFSENHSLVLSRRTVTGKYISLKRSFVN